MFAIEYAGRPLESFAFFAADLGYAAAFGEVAIEDLQMTGSFDGFFEGVDDVLSLEV